MTFSLSQYTAQGTIELRGSGICHVSSRARRCRETDLRQAEEQAG